MVKRRGIPKSAKKIELPSPRKYKSSSSYLGAVLRKLNGNIPAGAVVDAFKTDKMMYVRYYPLGSTSIRIKRYRLKNKKRR